MNGEQIKSVTVEPVTMKQLEEFFEQKKTVEGRPPRIHQANFQSFIDTPDLVGVKAIIPLHDQAVPQKLGHLVLKVRECMRVEFGIVDPAMSVVYKVPAGHTLRYHAPLTVPCRNWIKSPYQWDFLDQPTRDCYVFWIPRMVPGSTARDEAEHVRMLGEWLSRYDLPGYFFSCFGEPSLLAGLIGAHFQRTGERVPFDRDYVRTDVRGLWLGGFDNRGLDWQKDQENVAGSRWGCFALGIVPRQLS